MKFSIHMKASEERWDETQTKRLVTQLTVFFSSRGLDDEDNKRECLNSIR